MCVVDLGFDFQLIENSLPYKKTKNYLHFFYELLVVILKSIVSDLLLLKSAKKIALIVLFLF